MPEHLVCSCGAHVPLDEGLRQPVCPKCGALLELSKETGVKAGDPVEPVSAEQVATEKGPCWKLVCPCNKRMLVPRKAQASLGRCPKCGRRIRIPSSGESDRPKANPEPVAAARPAPPPAQPLAAEDDLSDLVLDLGVEAPAARAPEPDPPPVRSEGPASRAAALRTADILRSKKLSERTDGAGLISAWPLAGHLPRALAGFIDLTLGLLAAMLIVVGGSLDLLPESSRYWVVPVVAFYTAVLLNDCLLQATGGSIGKRLVVLTLRTPEGLAPSVPLVILRAIVKWLVVPGWLLAFVHPSQRALHDLLCNTCVLKGRVRHG